MAQYSKNSRNVRVFAKQEQSTTENRSSSRLARHPLNWFVMKRYVKTLAISSLVGFQGIPGYVSTTLAQTNSLPPVTVTGPSTPSPDPWGGSPGSGYSGGGGCQSCGGVPEAEYSGGGRPAPAPKTEAQKQAEREKCETARTDARSELQTSYTAEMGVCASRNSTTFGYFSEQVKRFLNESAGIGQGDCSTSLTRQYYQLLTIFDNRRDACVAAANKG